MGATETIERMEKAMINLTRSVAQFASIVVLLPLSLACAAQADFPMTSVELQAGVLIDKEANLAYFMSPDDSVVALSIESGDLLWRSSEVTKPLAVADGLLICQTDSSSESSWGSAYGQR